MQENAGANKNSKKSLIIVLMLLIVLIAGAAVLYKTLSDDAQKQNTSSASSEEAQDAPDFTVYDKDDNPVTLSSFEGKPTIVNFWASWCGPCKAEMPDFEKLYQELGGEINFVMVNLTDNSQETKKSALEFISKSGYTFPVYFDSDLNAAYTYGVSGIPMTLFINSEGKLIAGAKSMIDEDILLEGIDLISD